MSKAFLCTTFDLEGFRTAFKDDHTFPDFVEGCVGQRERCPETGREHIQFYIKTKKTFRITGLKNALGFEAHIEERKGTHQQAYDYCTKSDTRVSMFETWGNMTRETGRGARCEQCFFFENGYIC